MGLFLWSIRDYTQLFNFDDSLITALLMGCAASASAYVGTMVFCDDGIRMFKLVSVERSTENANDH